MLGDIVMTIGWVVIGIAVMVALREAHERQQLKKMQRGELLDRLDRVCETGRYKKDTDKEVA